MAFEMGSIPEGKMRGWTVRVNGREMCAVGQIELESRFGTLMYGLRPEGFDGWAFREQGGGGAVTLPWSRDEVGDIAVGLLREQRPNMGDEPVWCVIGGFVEPGETHAAAQAREADEEAGLDTVRASELEGLPPNANRAFFVADAARGEGVRAFGLQIPWGALELDPDDPDGDEDCWKFAEGTVPNMKKSADVRFFHWRRAVHLTADALALSAIAQLLAEELLLG